MHAIISPLSSTQTPHHATRCPRQSKGRGSEAPRLGARPAPLSPALGPVSRPRAASSLLITICPGHSQHPSAPVCTAAGLVSTVMVQCLVYSNVAAGGGETALATPGLHAASLCCALSISSSDLAPHRRLHSWCEASPQPGRCCCSQHTPSQNKDVISSASVTLYFCLN